MASLGQGGPQDRTFSSSCWRFRHTFMDSTLHRPCKVRWTSPFQLTQRDPGSKIINGDPSGWVCPLANAMTLTHICTCSEDWHGVMASAGAKRRCLVHFLLLICTSFVHGLRVQLRPSAHAVSSSRMWSERVCWPQRPCITGRSQAPSAIRTWASRDSREDQRDACSDSSAYVDVTRSSAVLGLLMTLGECSMWNLGMTWLRPGAPLHHTPVREPAR